MGREVGWRSAKLLEVNQQHEAQLTAGHWPQESILSVIFINDLAGETECTFIKFANATKLEVVDRLDVRAAIQRNLKKEGKWTKRNFMNFHKGKCKVLLLERNVSIYILRANQQEISLAKKDLSVPVNKLISVSSLQPRKLILYLYSTLMNIWVLCLLLVSLV